MLIEYNALTGEVISATVLNFPDSFTTEERVYAISQLVFDELPETSAACHVFDANTANNIWFSHKNGGTVIITVDGEKNFISADIEEVAQVELESVKTPDQLRIEQLETQLADVQLALAELFGA